MSKKSRKSREADNHKPVRFVSLDNMSFIKCGVYLSQQIPGQANYMPALPVGAFRAETTGIDVGGLSVVPDIADGDETLSDDCLADALRCFSDCISKNISPYSRIMMDAVFFHEGMSRAQVPLLSQMAVFWPFDKTTWLIFPAVAEKAKALGIDLGKTHVPDPGGEIDPGVLYIGHKREDSHVRH